MSVNKGQKIIVFVILFASVFLFTTNVNQRPTWGKKLSVKKLLNTHFDFSVKKIFAMGTQPTADKVRSLYYYVAGEPSTGYPSGFAGPPGGLIGLFSNVINHPSLNRAFVQNGIRSCDGIPTTGSLVAFDHSLGHLTLNFSRGKKKVPTHFNELGGNFYEKRIRFDRQGVPLLVIEMSCPTSSTSITGYMAIEDSRQVEMYFQYDQSGQQRLLDAYMSYPRTKGNSYDEKLIMRFSSSNGSDYNIWAVRTTDNESEGSFGVAVAGDHTDQVAQVSVVEDKDSTPDNSVPVQSGTQTCVDLSTDTTTTSCPSITAPNSTVHGDSFTIEGADETPVQAVELLQVIPEVIDFTATDIGATQTATVTLSNLGTQTATSLSALPMAMPFHFFGGHYPGTGGTCGASLASGAQCTLVVAFSPITTGAHHFSFSLNYLLGTIQYSSLVGLHGVSSSPSALPGVLTISEADPFDYGQQDISTSTAQMFTLSNVGGSNVTQLTAGPLPLPFGFTGGTYPGTGGNCGATLAAGASCAIEVQFSPVIEGAFSETLVFTYNSGTSTQTLTKSFFGTGAAATSGIAVLNFLDGANFSFENSDPGQVIEQILTLQNSGGATATAIVSGALSLPFAFKGGVYPGTGGDCGTTLIAGAICQVVIEYAPSAAGVYSESLSINYNDGAAAQMTSLQLHGSSGGGAVLVLSDGPQYNFGSIINGQSQVHQFTLTNLGEGTASSISSGSLSAPFQFLGGSYPGTGGTCATSLPPGATCSLIVEFAPTAVGNSTDQLVLTYSDGSASQTVTRNLVGVSILPALISISESDPYDFGSIVVGGFASHTFTLTNSGGGDATQLSDLGMGASFFMHGGTYPGIGGSCGAVIPAGTSCTVVLEFSPTTAGTQTATLQVDYNDGSGTLVSATRSLTGQGLLPAQIIISEADPFDFGTTVIGNTTNHTFTLTNSGGMTAGSLAGLGVVAPFQFQGGTYPGTGGTCGVSLAPASTCTVVVEFAPTAVGSFTNFMEISYFNGVSNQFASRHLIGTGGSPGTAVLVLSDAPTYDYGTVVTGSSLSHTFTVTNSGTVAATSISESGLAAPFSYVGGSYPGTGGTCTTTLAAAASCHFVIEFSPTAVGSFSDTIDLNYNDGVTTQQSTRPIIGVGGSAGTAILAISDAPTYNFGSVVMGGSLNYAFTVTNSGSVPATAMSGISLSSPFSYSGGSYPGIGGTCATTLAASATCLVEVSYQPTSSGAHNGTLNLSYNDGTAAQTTSRSITGTGANPALITISESNPYDFGTVSVGGGTNHTFTLTNTGGIGASTISETGVMAPYGFVGGAYPGTGGTCGVSLPAAASCTVVVDFNPTSAGTFTDSIEINYNDGLAAQLSTRQLTGVGTSGTANLSISDGPTYNYGTQAIGGVVDHSFTVTNSGTVAATSISGVTPSAPFQYSGGSFPGTGGTCGVTIAAAASCVVVVSYQPTSVGAHSATFDMTYHDGTATQTVSRNLSGTGAQPALLVISESDPYDYGTVTVSSSSSHTFTVSNTGGLHATSLSGAGLAAPYLFSGGAFPGIGGTCGATLSSSANCTVVIEFAPTSTGTFNDTFEMNYFDGAISQQATRQLTGVGN